MNQHQEDALQSLRSLALRSENFEAVDPLVDAVRGDSLVDPGPPIVLTLTVNADWHANSRYLCPPEQAVALLRSIADDIEKAQQTVADIV